MDKYQKLLIVLILIITAVNLLLLLRPGITAFFIQRQEGPVGYAMTPGDLEANISLGETKNLVFYIWNGYDRDRDVIYTLDGNISQISEIDAPDVVPYRIWTPVTVRVAGLERGIYKGTIYVDLGIVNKADVSKGKYSMGMNILMKL